MTIALHSRPGMLTAVAAACLFLTACGGGDPSSNEQADALEAPQSFKSSLAATTSPVANPTALPAPFTPAATTSTVASMNAKEAIPDPVSMAASAGVTAQPAPSTSVATIPAAASVNLAPTISTSVAANSPAVNVDAAGPLEPAPVIAATAVGGVAPPAPITSVAVAPVLVSVAPDVVQPSSVAVTPPAPSPDAQSGRSTMIADTIRPTVSIASQSEVGADGLVSVSGRASDNLRIRSVTWSSDRGASGAADVKMSADGKSMAWSVTAVKLEAGDNRLTFIAADSSGNTGDASVVVAYAPDAPGGSAPTPPPTPLPNTLRQVFVDASRGESNDANPGTYAAPLRTIGQAMKVLRPGDDVIIGPGVYRETIIVPTLAATAYTTAIRALTPGAAIVKGSDEVKNWKQLSADVWYVAWSGAQPEQVYRQGRPLTQIAGTVFGGYPLDPKSPVANQGDIWPGRIAGDKNSLPVDSFTYDVTDKRIYVRLSKPPVVGEALEVSTRTYVLNALSAINLVVDGLVFEHSNTSLTQRHGAVKTNGRQNTIRNVVVRDMDAFCVQVEGDDSALLDSRIERCGQIGIGAYGARVTVSRNIVTANNTRGFNKNWEAGGMKLTGSPALTDAFVTNNVVTLNTGDGIWFDWTPRRVTVSGNVTAYNSGHGIHYEASQAGKISGNFAYGNGQRGIYLLESSNTVVSGNSVFGNTMEGIAIANGTRSASNPSLLPYGNSITGNSIAWNDGRRNRMQFMLPGLEFGNTSDRNISQATDVTPRYSQGWVSGTNPYKQGLPAWRPFSGQDAKSTESMGPMPSTLAAGIAAKRLLDKGELPGFLQTPGVR